MAACTPHTAGQRELENANAAMKAAQLETKVYPAMSEEEAVDYRLALCDEATCASTVPHLIYAPVFSACYDSTVPNCDQLQFAHFA